VWYTNRFSSSERYRERELLHDQMRHEGAIPSEAEGHRKVKQKGRRADALALTADEGRDKLR
jgi:hypothetical protein